MGYYNNKGILSNRRCERVWDPQKGVWFGQNCHKKITDYLYITLIENCTILPQRTELPGSRKSSNVYEGIYYSAGKSPSVRWEIIELEVTVKKNNTVKKKNIKTFVLDTNVLIHDPESLFAFEDNYVVIPVVVVEELDSLKRGMNAVGVSARKALKIIDSLKGTITPRIAFHDRIIVGADGGEIKSNKDNPEGVKLENGGTVAIFPSPCPDKSPDDQIIITALAINNAKEFPKPVVVVSKDVAVRIKTNATGRIVAQDYTHDQTSIYQKYGRILSGKEHTNGILSVRYLVKDDNLYCLKGKDNITQVNRGKTLFDKIRPQNIEQECAIHALKRPEIDIVALEGAPGCGKTLLSLAAGLAQVTKEDPLYDQVIVIRPIVPAGYDIGYIPGSKEEKIRVWMDAVFDNLEFLFRKQKDYKKDNKNIYYRPYQYLIDSGLLYLEAMTYIRGRSIPRRYIIVDDSQNIRPIDAKTLVTRCGVGTKIVFCGDVQQIDTPFLDSTSNGLSHVIGRFINEENFCYIKFMHSVRSSLAEQASKLL